MNEDLEGDDLFPMLDPFISPYAFRRPTKFVENLLSLCRTTILEQIKVELNSDVSVDSGLELINHDNVKRMLKDYNPQMSIKSLSKSMHKFTGLTENSKTSAGHNSLPTSPNLSTSQGKPKVSASIQASQKFRTKLNASFARIDHIINRPAGDMNIEEYTELAEIPRTTLCSESINFYKANTHEVNCERLHLIISDHLNELDKYVTNKLEKLRNNKELDNAYKIQKMIRYWLSEAHLKLFVRDIFKFMKVIWVTDKLEKFNQFQKWKNIVQNMRA